MALCVTNLSLQKWLRLKSDLRLGTSDIAVQVLPPPPPLFAVVTVFPSIVGVGQTSQVTFTWNDVVLGFDNTSIVLTGAAGTLSNVVEFNPMVYVATFTPDPFIVATATIQVPQSGTEGATYHNAAGSSTVASNIASLAINTTTGPTTSFALGMNFSGMENQFPQVTTATELAYYATRLFTIGRFPIGWSQAVPPNVLTGVINDQTGIQPIIGGALDTTAFYVNGGSYCAALDSVLATAASLGMKLIIDLHTFGNGANRNVLLNTSSIGGNSWTIGSINSGNPSVVLNAAVDPTGGMTATEIVFPAVSGTGNASIVYQELTSLLPFLSGGVFSLYLRGAVGGEITYLFADGNTQNSVQCVLTTSWQRFNIAYNPISGANFPGVGTDLRDPNQAATAAQTIFAAFAALEPGASPTPYAANGNSISTAVIGQPGLLISDFAELWSLISQRYKGNPGVKAYGLMNEPVNGFSSATNFAMLQAAITAIRANGDATLIHINGVNFSGAWNWVSGQGQPFNNSTLNQLVDPSNNLVFEAHSYLDNDSSGSNFAWALEIAKAGASPPGTPTSATIGPTRLDREFLPWAMANSVNVAIGETGGSSDFIYKGGVDNWAAWNTALSNEIAVAQANDFELYIWGAGAGFGPFYGLYPGPSSQSSQFSADFTSAGVQSTVMSMLLGYTGYAGAQPLAYTILQPVTITPTGNPEAPIVTPVVFGSNGVASPNFTVRYNGIISSSITITPHDFLTDGTTAAGGSFTPTSVTLPPGTNALATVTYTPSQVQTFTFGATNNAGLIDQPTGVLTYSTEPNLFATAANLSNVFALYRLNGAYIGPIVTLQRQQDNAQMTFALNVIGNLPRQAIQDWASARIIPIINWFNQGGNGGVASSAGLPAPFLTLNNADGYPEITVNAIQGLKTTSFSQPSLSTPGFGQQTILARVNAANPNIIISQDIFTDNWRLTTGNYDVGPNTGASYTVSLTGASFGTWQLLGGSYSNLYTTNNVNGYLDGTLVNSVSAPAFTFAPADTSGEADMFFFRFGGDNWLGSMQTLIITYDELTPTVIGNIQTAITNYYSTPLPDSLTAVAPTIVAGNLPTTSFVSGVNTIFTNVSILDQNSGTPTDTVTITLSGAAATLTGSGITGSNPYTIASDTPANVTAILQSIIFHTTATVGSVTNVAISATSSAGPTANTSLAVTLAAFGMETPFTPPVGTFTPIGNFKGYMLGGPEVTGSGSSFFPFAAEIDYMAAQGFGMFKLPTTISNAIQGPTAFQPWVISYINNMKSTIDYAFTKGMYVLIAFYDSGAGLTGTNTYGAVGIDPTATNSFADQRSRLASRFKNYPNVIIEMTNEPKNQNVDQWFAGQNVGVAAIRAAGFTGKIGLCPNGFQHTDDWTSSGNAAKYVGYSGDPLNNFVFCFHAYLDAANQGAAPGGYIAQPGRAAHILDDATTWMQGQGYQGILTEFGIGGDPWQPNPGNTMIWLGSAGSVSTNFNTEGPILLAYMKTNSSAWLGWTEFSAGVEFSTVPNSPSGTGNADGGYTFNPEPARLSFTFLSPLAPNTQVVNILIGGL